LTFIVDGGVTDLFRPDGVGFDLQWAALRIESALSERKIPRKSTRPDNCQQSLVSVLPFPSNRLHANLRGHPDIFMMEPADAHQLDDLPLFWRLDWPAVRRIPR